MQIRDSHGRLVGKIVHSDNNTQKAYDQNGVYVGTYNESADVTLDKFGRLVGKGNSLAYLIWDDN